MGILLKPFIHVMFVIITLMHIAAAQDTMPTFSIAISAPQRSKTGSPVVLDITITNISNNVIAFDEQDPTEGERDFSVEIHDDRGNAPPETKYMKAVRKEDQGQGPQFVLMVDLIQRDLKPGESLKKRANLDKLFALKPGIYTVELSRPDFQIGHVLASAGDATINPENSDLHKPQGTSSSRPNSPPVPLKAKAVAKSNIVTFTITP